MRVRVYKWLRPLRFSGFTFIFYLHNIAHLLFIQQLCDIFVIISRKFEGILSSQKCTMIGLGPSMKYITWKIFLYLKFRQMGKKINKSKFPSVYSSFNGRFAFLPLKLNKSMENWIWWSFCSFRGTWGSEISAMFSLLTWVNCEAVIGGLWANQEFSPNRINHLNENPLCGGN